MKKTYIAPSIIKVKKMETTGELLAGSPKKFVVHDGSSLPPGIEDDEDLADKAWSKKNNLWDNDEW